MEDKSMSLVTLILGDPQAQQAAVTKAFQRANARLILARSRGDKVGELKALAEMKRIAAQGSKLAKTATGNVKTIDSTAANIKGAVSSIGKGALTIGIAAFAIVILIKSGKK